MTVEISDKKLDAIMQTAIKDEIDFLTRALLRDPAIRGALWCWVMQNIVTKGLGPLDFGDEALLTKIQGTLKKTGLNVPSGGSGGGDGGDSGSNEGGGSGEGDGPMKAGDCRIETRTKPTDKPPVDHDKKAAD